ncbi:unnamed protein product [Toxocara canis]|uniref:Chloride channel protein n=1 Tax=Toxocara canis TaxID=6265 RepID=A0A183UDK6_TOXCA|nr:unnamed protein product [Toxocara canis]
MHKGSGIPEMKTILRGCALKECLTLRTLVAKIVGVILAIGSGFPIGKEGPFVHIGSIVAHQISWLERNSKPMCANESRFCEMLVAGCAAGVACTFCAPIGGVLFSIEVMAFYFAVRDYWRGFFAAACGSTLFSLLRIFTNSRATVTTFYQTHFKSDCYYPEELIAFLLLGCFNGLIGAVFICFHRHVVLFLRKNRMAKIFQTNWLIYPLFVSILYSAITFPKGIGKYITGEIVYSRTLREFFINCTWNVLRSSARQVCNENFTTRWSADESIFVKLSVFIVGFYFLAIVASTLPVPGGIFMPVFVVGGGIGRLVGELLAVVFPLGLRGEPLMPIYPGIYAVVGAASLCGAVTRTVSVAMITFELTGQIVLIIPVMIAVAVANIISSSFQPSIFDSIIKMKHLPYLPDMPKATSAVHAIRVEEIMVRNVVCLSLKCTYRDIQTVLVQMPRLRAFPVVDHPATKVLLGSISRGSLLHLLNEQVGDECRHAEAKRRANVDNKLPLSLFSDRTHSILRKISRKTVPVKRWKTEGDLFSLYDEIRRQTGAESPCGNFDNAVNVGVNLEILRRSKKLHSTHDVYTSVAGALRNLASFHFHDGNGREDVDLFGDTRERESSIEPLLNYHSRRTIGIQENAARRLWEHRQLMCQVNFPNGMLDSAPFQLVRSTSLYKVHSLFSMHGIRTAYVTECGLRNAIERIQTGELRARIQRIDGAVEELHNSASDPSNQAPSVGPECTEEYDSDDYDDCILPRFKIEEVSHRLLELERKLTVALMASRAVTECIRQEFHEDKPSPILQTAQSSRQFHFKGDSVDKVSSNNDGTREQRSNVSASVDVLHYSELWPIKCRPSPPSHSKETVLHSAASPRFKRSLSDVF